MVNLNATVTAREEVSDDLLVLKIRPDAGKIEFEAGQFTVLGLPGAAPRVPGSKPEHESPPPDKLIRRAYSIADLEGDSFEFYLKRVDQGALTPRLFALHVGDRLWIGPKATGSFTLHSVPQDRDLILVGTGTGLAPYIAMLHEAHLCNKGRKFTIVHGARHVRDLGYRDELEKMDTGCETMRYVPTLSRPEPSEHWDGHVGRVNTVFDDGTVQADPERDHVFLCGAPDMINDMQKKLEGLGFLVHSEKHPGNLHIERYW